MSEATEASWLPAPPRPALPSDQVHVWCASLRLPPWRIEELGQWLSADELQRAERYRFQSDRDHFVASQGLLRCILSRYLEVKPHQLHFQHGPFGKPALVETLAGDTISFNLSHSTELALYVVARKRRVGIDVEAIRSLPDARLVAEQFFSPRENMALAAFPSDLREQAFFCCWTRKEAYLKARGEGLYLPLDQFEVSVAPGEPARLVKTLEGPEETERWSLRALWPAPGYAATVVVEGCGWDLKCWQWRE